MKKKRMTTSAANEAVPSKSSTPEMSGETIFLATTKMIYLDGRAGTMKQQQQAQFGGYSYQQNVLNDVMQHIILVSLPPKLWKVSHQNIDGSDCGRNYDHDREEREK